MDVRSETCKDYYNFYKEICLYSQRRRKAACSDNSERVINANFCLLFNMLTQMLIDAGVTWSPRGVAKALMARGVRVIKL